MTRRQRVIEAVTFHNTDIIPYQIDFTGQAYERTAAYLNDSAFIKNIGNHLITAYYSGLPAEIRPGYFRDDFGVVWNRTGADKDIGVIDSLLLPEPDADMVKLPEVPEAWLRGECERVMASKEDAFTLGSIGFSLFERAWTLTGMEDLLVYMLTEPRFVHKLFRCITDFNLKVMKIYMEYDFDGIMFGDDWGQQKGLIMGPELWRTFIKPYLAEMYAFAKDEAKFIAQHSCGDILTVFDDLTDIGLNIYQTFQPEIYDIKAVKAAYGNKLTFWGGISTQRLLPFETPLEVTRKAREIMDIMRENGGYIAAPTHSIPGDVPPENIAALIELFSGQK